MTNLWKGLIGAGLFAAVVLYFNLSDKEQIKQEQRVMQLEQKLAEKQFDDEFTDAWNGEAGSKIKKQRAQDTAALESKIAKAEAKRDSLDDFDQDFVQAGQQALRDEDERLSAKPASVAGGDLK